MSYKRIEIDFENLESRIISSFLRDLDAREEIVSKITTDNFRRSTNKKIFTMLLDYYSKSKEFNLEVFLDEMQELESKKKIAKFLTDNPTSENIGVYIEALINASIKWKLEEAYQEFSEEKITILNADEKFNDLFEKSRKIILSKPTASLVDVSQYTKDFNERMTKLKNHEADVSGVKINFSGIDKLTNGFSPGELIILAARPSIGKTALALNFVSNILKDDNMKRDEVVVLFSLEMSADQLIERWVCMNSNLDNNVYKNGSWDDEQEKMIKETNEEISKWNLKIFDGSKITVNEIHSTLRQLSKSYKIKLVVIDYLQLIESSKNSFASRNEEVAKISRTLKIIAKEIKTPVLAVAQLSRNIEQRTGEDRRPRLSDLRESGAIEQDADIVSFIDYDRSQVDDSNSNNEIVKFKSVVNVEFTIAKNRSGETGLVKLSFNKSTGKFTKFIRKKTNDEN